MREIVGMPELGVIGPMHSLLYNIVPARNRSSSLLFQRIQERDEGMDVGSGELLIEARHFAFDAIVDQGTEPRVRLAQPMQVGAFVAAGVVTVAMGAVHQK